MPTVKNPKTGEIYTVLEKTLEKQRHAWAELARKAEEAGLIFTAFAGVMLLMHPDIQLEESDGAAYYRIQTMTGNGHRLKKVTEGQNGL